MDYINIYSQSTGLPTQIGDTFNVTWDNSTDLLLSLGWRICPEQPAVEEGHTRISAVAVEGDGVSAAWEVVDRLTSEIEAEKEAARRASFVASGLIPLASLYRTSLRSYGGDNAETNRAITAEVVAGWFLAKVAAGTMTDADRDAQSLLQFGYAKLSAWNGTDETWTLPWEVVP